MARPVTKAGANRYCQARLEAAKYNDRFASRAGAAEEIPGVSEDSLKKYELDITRPPNDVVALMADAYNAPELIPWYCANECPLGRNCREVPDMPPERMLARLLNARKTLFEATDSLTKIMDDGLGPEDLYDIPQIRSDLLETKRRVDEAITILDKQQKRFSD